MTDGPRFEYGHIELTPPKTGIWVPVNNEQLGILTPEQEARAEQDRLELDRRRAEVTRDLPAAIHRLDHLTDPVSRAVLDLHARRPGLGDWECAVCVANELDMRDWPCSTVDVVAAAHGIDLTDAWLFRRPTDGSLDLEEKPE